MLDKMHNKLLLNFSPRQIVAYFWVYLEALKSAGMIEIKDNKVYWIEE